MDAASVEPKLKRAKRRLALRRFILGRTHRATGDAYYQAGTLYRVSGDMDGAARCLAMAEKIHRQRLGPGHPAVAMDLLAMGEYQARWGERRRAVESLERAERILEANLRKDPRARFPEVVGHLLRRHLGILLCTLAGVHVDLEQRGKARTCLERALRMLAEDAGPESEHAITAAAALVALGVDPRVVVRETGGETAASLLASAFRAVHGRDPIPEPIL